MCDITLEYNSRGVAQPGRAIALGAIGRQFDSGRPDQIHHSVRSRITSSGHHNLRRLWVPLHKSVDGRGSPFPGRYYRRSRVESKMRCLKLLGQRLMARDFDCQVAEIQVRIAVLNGYTALGISVTEAVG